MTEPTPDPEFTPVLPTDPGDVPPPETGGDDPPEIEVDLDEQARKDAERDRELREKYGDQEY